MDIPTTVLLGVVAVLAINQLVMRIPRLRVALFWPVQIFLLLLGTVILIIGLPGYEDIPIISWVVGLLFFLHIARSLEWWAGRPEEPVEGWDEYEYTADEDADED